MNSLHFIFARLLLVALAFWGVMFASVGVTAADSRAPELSLSVRGLADGAIEVGESFRVAVRVDASENATTKLELAPASGSWLDATTIELTTADGQTVSARARPAPQTARQVTVVDEENPANALWWFPPADLQSVGVGDYTVRARLRIRDGTGWKGEVIADPAALRVVPQSSDPERVTQRKIARARAALLGGDPAKAGEILNAVLEAEPNQIVALVLHAAMSLEGGNRNTARVCIQRALMLSNRPGEEPSAEIHALAQRIESATDEAAPAGGVPAWSQIPNVLLQPVRIAPPAASALTAQTPIPPKPATSPVRVEPTPVATAPAKGPDPSASATAATVRPASVEKFDGIVIAAAELTDAKVSADSAGQWATAAVASSQYDRKTYSAAQATGAPNIKVAGNSPDAWSPAHKNEGTEWIEVTFAQPMHATEVRLRQNDTPGCVARVEAIEADSTAHLWWQGADPYVVPAIREIVWFGVRVPRTSYLVAKIKITLNLTAVSGWKEIDAVQLVGSAD
ncbi:MAG: hypothetical protein ABIZ04_07555 [Opitutus sp.]